ncbi:GNAT family N-acetyltransferase [Curvivirga aplysinae]|uniref:GNAT family N-acetyltransferase n=1 Tax=Curvivirga aplysinae TaxID=2529852 RepID=UPI0012BD1924|nr:GNAT family N-acetyltransferase [Curvivirga aplysinae]MTI10139.1 N-acetyltransferase [Curvivirga aplysinae]
MSEKRPRLIPLSHANLGALLALNATTGWSLNREDWLTLLTSARLIGHVNDKEEIVTCGAITPFSADKGSIGCVITHPDYKRQGLGKELIERIVGLLPEENVSLCLISTDVGQGLYEQFGFKKVDEITRGFAKTFNAGKIEELLEEGCSIRESLPVKDLGTLLRLDADRFGAPRIKMVKRRMGQSKYRAFLYDAENELQGYALGSEQEGITVIGGLTAPNEDMALALVQSIADRAEPQYQVDIPVMHKSLIERMRKAGMDWVETAPIMIRGDWDITAGWDQYFALSTQSYL